MSVAPQAGLLGQVLHGRFTTQYILRPDVSYVEIVTTFENDEPGIFVQPADFLVLGGATRLFTQRFGYTPPSLFASVGFLAGGRGEKVNYAWLCGEGELVMPYVDQGISAPFCGPGFTVGSLRSIVRYLVVGDGTVESVTSVALDLLGEAHGYAEGDVQDGNGAPPTIGKIGSRAETIARQLSSVERQRISLI
jgi:hypothetical protein